MTETGTILAIESATGSVGCAVGGPDGVLGSAFSTRERRHAESLAPQIEFVMAQAGLSLGDVGVIAVDEGPGLYTGLRVGITTALALAHTLGVAMVGLGSLDVLAHGVRHHPHRVHAVIDAKRGEVFHASYERAGETLRRRSDPVVADPSELGRSLAAAPEPVIVVGDGVGAHPEAFAGITGVAHDTNPRADDLLELAVREVRAGRLVDPAEITPQYLRRPDAVANWAGRP